MAYTKVGPFVDGGPPYLSAADLNTLEAGIATGAAGPTRIAAEQNGVTATGTDVSAAFTALLAGVNAFTEVILPTGTINLGTAAFNIDVSKVALIGDRTTLAGTGTINLFSSAVYGNRQGNWGAATRGVIFQGLTLNIGHATYNTVGMFRLTDGGAISSTINIIGNAWKVVWDHFHIQGGSINAPAGAINAGEDMIWQNCMIADGVVVAINDNGDWHFTGCSIDNTQVQVSGANVYFENCHFENPGSNSAGYRMVAVGSTGSVTITNSQLIINDPHGSGGGNWTMAPFTVDPGNTLGGLVITNMQVPRGDWIHPETTDAVPVLVAGGGRAVLNGITTYTAGSITYALAEASSVIANGSAEAGSLIGWTTAGSASWSIDTTAGNHNRGTSSHKAVVSAGATGDFYQDFAVTPGRLLYLQLWRRYTIGSGGSINCQIYFISRTNAVISTTDFDTFTATTSANYKGVIQPVPAGASYARIDFFLTGGTGGVTAYVDDVIANLA